MNKITSTLVLRFIVFAIIVILILIMEHYLVRDEDLNSPIINLFEFIAYFEIPLLFLIFIITYRYHRSLLFKQKALLAFGLITIQFIGIIIINFVNPFERVITNEIFLEGVKWTFVYSCINFVLCLPIAKYNNYKTFSNNT